MMMFVSIVQTIWWDDLQGSVLDRLMNRVDRAKLNASDDCSGKKVVADRIKNFNRFRCHYAIHGSFRSYESFFHS